ncbi:MAG TPA: TetR/AcrR family transcriptional regulator [Magnetospirillaceae bacterium]|nr:TetR/AcrR family transcriptional regulator [Magnetospirillaceae bacterium]
MGKQANKRQQQAVSTKAALFESAVALFNEKGFHAVTIEDITRRAGTAKGSFYTYFRSKSDIVIEEFRVIDDFYRRYSKSLSRYPNALEKIYAFARAQMKYVRDQVGLEMLKILYSSNIMSPSAGKSLIDTNRYLHSLLRELIEEGQREGLFRTDVSADRLALLYTRGHRGVFLDWAISDSAFDLVEDGVEFCKVIVCPALMTKRPKEIMSSE